MEIMPVGATHADTGPSNTRWLRITENIHDYWCEGDRRWITFEGGHNPLRDFWIPVKIGTTGGINGNSNASN